MIVSLTAPQYIKTGNLIARNNLITLKVNVASLIITHSLSQTDYKYLAEWLGICTYIPPAERFISPLLFDTLLKKLPVYNASDLFLLWHYLQIIECYCTLDIQEGIAHHVSRSQITKPKL